MSMHLISRSFLVCACALMALGQAAAVDHELRLGPNEFTAEINILNKQIDQGATRLDAITAHAEVSARFYGFGVTLDGWMAIDDDEFRDIGVGEITELRARVDYLIEIPDVIQILPHYETSYYPATGNSATGDGLQRQRILDVLDPFRTERWGDEPHWLGVDAWLMLPWEGFEVGGSFDFDVAKNAGWRGAVGARQFVQIGNLDLAFHEVLNFGNTRYHDFLIGSNARGLTTIEAGMVATLPLPWEYLYVTANLGGHWWLQSKDRNVLADSVEIVGGLGIEFRLSDF